MEKDKSRGIKHIKDKKKYKGNSTKNPKYVPSKYKSNLGTNWDRYENQEDTEEFKLTSSTDFSLLSNVPINQGHHFCFKSDKVILEETENRTPTELLRLDLNMLKESISTVPFFERIGIEENFFSGHQLKFMKREAGDNFTNYNKKYVNIINKPAESSENDDSKNSQENSGTVQHLNVDNNDESNDYEHTTLYEEENLGCPEEVEKNAMTTVDKLGNLEGSEEELEQWLDDILDA